MTDVSTKWITPAGIGDWRLSLPDSVIWVDQDGNSIVDQNGQPVSAIFTPGDGLTLGDELLTAVLISLFTDAEARADDVVMDGGEDPRGWWGGPIGSKIWLRTRSKATTVALALVKRDIEQALAWLIEDNVVATIAVLTEWTRPSLLGAQVVLFRNDGTSCALSFGRLWENF